MLPNKLSLNSGLMPFVVPGDRTNCAPYDVTILCWQAPTRSDKNAQKIGEFLGVTAGCVNLTASDLSGVSAERPLPICGCVVVHADTLVQMAATLKNGLDDLRVIIAGERAQVFVYGFRPTDSHAAIARVLSLGNLDRVQAPPAMNGDFRVAAGERHWCQQFSGLSLRSTDSRIDSHFVDGANTVPYSTLIVANGHPFFVRLHIGRADLFLSACGELADLDEPVPAPFSILQWFSRLAPLMMFLRGVLGTRVWHDDHPRACFVIDDPLLNRNHYGFLEYPALLKTIAELRCAASIAFIPWNHRRSHRGVTGEFASALGSISLCVHGCDHTGAEFAARDIGLMRQKAQLALDRMTAHRTRFDLAFDDVMVFPQGLFSGAAIRALDDCGYLAAVNTDVCPVDLQPPLTLRERLDVAVTRVSDFPVFGRRYPRQIAEFAFDLFLGRPALAVEHHGYFRNGLGAFTRFVTELNGLQPGLEWTSLAKVCSSASRTRVAANGDVHVRFYTHRFSVSNTLERAQTYVLVRPCVDRPSAVLMVDGKTRAWEQRTGDLTFTFSLGSGETANVRLLAEHRGALGQSSERRGFAKVRVFARRVLSEFRDNHVDTSDVLSGIVNGARLMLASVQRRKPRAPYAPVS